MVDQVKKSQTDLKKTSRSYKKKLTSPPTVLKTGNMDKILVISDLHIPYHHPDSFSFLNKLKNRYDWDKVINIGDEMDWHSINVSHVINPDLPSAADELEVGKFWMKKLEKMYPDMTLLESNHGSMVLRRAMAKGMSKFFLKDYNEILFVPVPVTFPVNVIVSLPVKYLPSKFTVTFDWFCTVAVKIPVPVAKLKPVKKSLESGASDN